AKPEYFFARLIGFLGVTLPNDWQSLPLYEIANAGHKNAPRSSVRDFLSELHRRPSMELEKHLLRERGLKPAWRWKQTTAIDWPLIDQPGGAVEIKFDGNQFVWIKDGVITACANFLADLRAQASGASESEDNREARRLENLLDAINDDRRRYVASHVHFERAHGEFNIVAYGGYQFGVRQSLGEIKLPFRPDLVGQGHSSPDVVIGRELDSVLQRIDEIETGRKGDTGPPDMVHTL